jgi:hypothetical protein
MGKGLTIVGGIVLASLLIITASCVSRDVPVTETYYETEYKTETYTTTEDVMVDHKEGETNLKSTMIWSAGFPDEGVGFNYYSYEISMIQHSTSQIKVTFLNSVSEQNLKEGIMVYNLTGKSQISIPPARQTWGEGATETKQWFDNFNSLIEDPKYKLPVLTVNARQGIYYDSLLAVDRCIDYCSNIFIINSDPALRNQLTAEPTHVGESFGLGKAPNFRVSNSVYAVRGGNREPAYIVFDASGIKAFAILDSWFMFPISDVQLLWTDEVTEERTVTKEEQVPYQVEKQRTVVQAQRVPFWEVIFH